MGEKLSRKEMARRGWQRFWQLGEQHMHGMNGAIQKMGLTPVMAAFLDEVAKMPPGPMSQLVARMDVDPGWVTDIVDKLEARGEVVRRASPQDRRVKIIELTPAGRRTWEQIQDLMYSPPPEVMALPEEDLRALLRISERLSAVAKKA